MLAHSLDQGCQQITRGTDPPGQRGAVKINAFAGVDL